MAGDARNGPDDHRWMTRAIELSRLCPPSPGAYSVGAVVVDEFGDEIASGFSRENDRHAHAEEVALAKLSFDDRRLAGATIYSTLEPCSQRRSRPLTCSQLILAAGIPRVVLAWREPALFVADCRGVEALQAAGVAVVELSEFAERARARSARGGTDLEAARSRCYVPLRLRIPTRVCGQQGHVLLRRYGPDRDHNRSIASQQHMISSGGHAGESDGSDK